MCVTLPFKRPAANGAPAVLEQRLGSPPAQGTHVGWKVPKLELNIIT